MLVINGSASGLGFANAKDLASDSGKLAMFESIQQNFGQSPLRRFAEPAEIAHSVRYIIENDYFTTRTIAVGGGRQV